MEKAFKDLFIFFCLCCFQSFTDYFSIYSIALEAVCRSAFKQQKLSVQLMQRLLCLCVNVLIRKEPWLMFVWFLMDGQSIDFTATTRLSFLPALWHLSSLQRPRLVTSDVLEPTSSWIMVILQQVGRVEVKWLLIFHPAASGKVEDFSSPALSCHVHRCCFLAFNRICSSNWSVKRTPEEVQTMLHPPPCFTGQFLSWKLFF